MCEGVWFMHDCEDCACVRGCGVYVPLKFSQHIKFIAVGDDTRIAK